jgi:hypothetical protein|tara:strand:- start:6238 stop:7503 length:1266 start_codon:yes stop_codon:yes gene_type:complete
MPIGTRPFEFNRLESQGYANSATACISDTEWRDGTGEVYYLLINNPNPTIASIGVGSEFYTTDEDGDDPGDLFDGQSEWYGVRTAADTASVAAVQIAANGEVVDLVSSCNTGAILSISGAVPYVDYYLGQAVYMYKTGSQDWNSIEGAVSYSLTTVTSSMSASHFNDFISASVGLYFDQSITGQITDPSNQISSSLQFQGYPFYGQSFTQNESSSNWSDLGQDHYLIKYAWTEGDGGKDLDTMTGLKPGTGTGHDGNYSTSANYVGYNLGTSDSNNGRYVGDGNFASGNYYFAWPGDDVASAGNEQILVNQDYIISDNPSADVSSFDVEMFARWYSEVGTGAITVSVELWQGGTWSDGGTIWNNSGGTKKSTLAFDLACRRGTSSGTFLAGTVEDSKFKKMGTLNFRDNSTGGLTVSLTAG